MWLRRLLGRSEGAEGWTPQPAEGEGKDRPAAGPPAPGFAEGPATPPWPPRARERLATEAAAHDPGYVHRAPVPPRDARDAPFPSIGPHGHRGRLRERLLERGPDSLADYEMLEMLLFFAFKTGDTKPLAKSLINRYGSFAAVLSAPVQQLMQTRGLGPHSVAAIKLVQGAALRLARAEAAEKPVLNNWERLMDYLHAAMARERVEQFRILFLDPKNRLLADEAQARGTVNHTPVYPREVVRRALELHATALILVHNHPSGDPTPSREDVLMTAEVKKAAAALAIVVHDHVIVGNGRTFSFRREGLL
jgi:DNA repair protein RadC